MSCIRVMTYNVGRCQRHNGIPAPAAVAQVIAAAAPDLVALQEIDCTHGGDHLAALATTLGMQAYALPVVGGNAFLSYYPMRGIQSVPLGTGGCCLRGEVDIGQRRIHLCNVRIESRCRQREQYADLLGAEVLGSRRAAIPTLLVGDFGLGCGGADWQLHGSLRRAGRPLLHPTYPASFPLLSRDRIYASSELRVLDITAVRGPLARQASRHLPLLVTVRLIDPRHYLRVDAPLPAGRWESAPG